MPDIGFKYFRCRSEPSNRLSHNFGARIPELDGVRGTAILMVLLYHLFSYTMLYRPVVDVRWARLAHLAARVTEHGGYGVDLFFVLSGFLITGILLDTRFDTHYFRSFYGRRALRIFPLYYTMLAVILLCYRGSGEYVLLSFFQLSNIAPLLGVTMVNGAMWSLSVEEHFYLGWPLIVRNLSFRNVALAAAIVWVAEPVIRGIAFPHVATVFPYSWFRLDGIASGALIACFVRSTAYSQQRARQAAILLALTGILIEIAGSPWNIRQHQTQFGAAFEYPPINMICAAVVMWGACASGLMETFILRLWPLRICGDLSYCLYLTHMMVMDAYDASLRLLGYPLSLTSFRGLVVRAVAVLAGSFMIAAISRRCLEHPALRLKRFLEPRARSPICKAPSTPIWLRPNDKILVNRLNDSKVEGVPAIRGD
jgi:peptidoglycan/LPS O-acetylase OafA/YrhL